MKWRPSGKIALIVVQTIRGIGFILLYVGTICVMVGAWTMTPETAYGRGSVLLVARLRSVMSQSVRMTWMAFHTMISCRPGEGYSVPAGLRVVGAYAMTQETQNGRESVPVI